MMSDIGPVMLDLEGCELSAEEREILQHPACGGVILFTRNYYDPQQLQALTAAIRRQRALLIAVDQEGGRVQRFRDGFAWLPPLRRLGMAYDEAPEAALHYAETAAWLMASEVLAAGVDFSFAPVLDIDHGHSEVIGDRALHADPEIISRLASAYVDGMHRAGMSAVGKHFPGHGYVTADSHTDLPQDERACAEILAHELIPFRALSGRIDAVMPAHVIYADCDSQPAGFSSYWLQEVLRDELAFDGVIFSDDLSMQAAREVGDSEARARLALDAGCDMLLVCNDRDAAIRVLESLESWSQPEDSSRRLAKMRRRQMLHWADLHDSKAYRQARDRVEQWHG